MPLYLSRREAADFLSAEGFKTAASTLTKLASTSGGPPFSNYGRKPVYTQDDLLRWAQARTSQPRASTTEPKRFVAEEVAGKAVTPSNGERIVTRPEIRR